MEKGILFNGDMVRAILDGKKTQTRRPMPGKVKVALAQYEDGSDETNCIFRRGDQRIHPPYHVGDRLYVRETWRRWDFLDCPHDEQCQCPKVGTPIYKASDPSDFVDEYRWRPSTHMPKSAARIWLKVVKVYPQMVGDISEEDARKEGFGSKAEFLAAWAKIYGDDLSRWAWVIEFEKE